MEKEVTLQSIDSLINTYSKQRIEIVEQIETRESDLEIFKTDKIRLEGALYALKGLKESLIKEKTEKIN